MKLYDNIWAIKELISINRKNAEKLSKRLSELCAKMDNTETYEEWKPVYEEAIDTADKLAYLDTIHKKLLLNKYKLESKEIVKSFIKKLFH